jgi:glycosyltransferase involved in cell wall biosynthesis
MITYNQERFIAQAIESVLAQKTDFRLELVVGEDGSTDGTRGIVENFSLKYPAIIRLLPPTPNMGMQANFARTLQACTGEYVALLEGDDYWNDPEKLSLQVAYLQANSGCALSHHKVSYLQNETGQVLKEFPPPSRRDERADAALLAHSNFVQTCSTAFRRSQAPVLTREFASLKVGDLPFFALLGQHGWIGYIDRNMAVYRVHGSNNWFSKPEEYRARAGHDMARYLARSLKEPHRHLWIEETLSLSISQLRSASRNGRPTDFAYAVRAFCIDTCQFKWIRLPGFLAHVLWNTARFVRTYVCNYLARHSNASSA